MCWYVSSDSKLNEYCCIEWNSAPGGDLQTLMDDDMVPYERDAVKFVRQVLEGLLFLHERNMAHLDIKVKSIHIFIPSHM